MNNFFRGPRLREACEEVTWNRQAFAAIEIDREATTEVLTRPREEHRIAEPGLVELDVNEAIEHRSTVWLRGGSPSTRW